MRSLVTSIFLYACETWTLTAELQRRIQLTGHGNEVLPQDASHLLQRPCYQPGSRCQDPAGIQTTGRPPDHRKEMQTTVIQTCLRSSGLVKTILQGTVKGEKSKAERRRGEKTTSGYGQAWSSPSPRGQWKTEKNGGDWL